VDKQCNGECRKKVRLCEVRGETSVFIDAEIDETGNLVITGQDIGKAPKRCFGDSDYEYWLTVPESEKHRVLQVLAEKTIMGTEHRAFQEDVSPERKDAALLRLVEQVYGGNACAVSALMDLLRANDIPYSFSTY